MVGVGAMSVNTDRLVSLLETIGRLEHDFAVKALDLGVTKDEGAEMVSVLREMCPEMAPTFAFFVEHLEYMRAMRSIGIEPRRP